MKLRNCLISLVSLCLALSSCIRNDLDYPWLFGGFTAFEVEDQKSVEIDPSTRTVTVYLNEAADKAALKLTRYELTGGARLENKLESVLDLREPVAVTIKTWQDYHWTIKAVQEIRRYVVCDNQVGDASFQEDNLVVLVQVLDQQPLSSIVIRDMKLGPEGSEITSTTGYEYDFTSGKQVTREVSLPMTLDCVLDRTFIVAFRGKETVWTFKAVQVAVQTDISAVIPWCRSAQVEAVFDGTGSPMIQYRRISESEWIDCEDVTVSGLGVSATLAPLDEGTAYAVRIVNGAETGPEHRFTTEMPLQLYNMDFDAWHSEGKIWFPFPEGASSDQLVWDTANKATGNFLGSISLPEESFTASPGGKAVKLESTYAVVKFAAGNIFTGSFVGLKGLGAELSWGIPFASKPASLHGFYCYKPALVDYADPDHESLKGKPDVGQIQVILTDWEEPFHVISTTGQYLDTDKDPGIIAYGNLEVDETEDGVYTEFDLPLEYRSYRAPRYIVVVAASSRYGDFFTGGKGSTLWIDNFNFEYR